MKVKIVVIFFMAMLGADSALARQNFLYDFKKVTMPIDGGVISFRLFGTNDTEDEPEKVRTRGNPYTLSIRYIANAPFTYATISGLQFLSRDDSELIFGHIEKESDRLGKESDFGYAGFYYGDLSKAIQLEYVDYIVKGTLTIYKEDDKAIAVPFEVVIEKDYKEKVTWDFWEGVMGI